MFALLNIDLERSERKLIRDSSNTTQGVLDIVFELLVKKVVLLCISSGICITTTSYLSAFYTTMYFKILTLSPALTIVNSTYCS